MKLGMFQYVALWGDYPVVYAGLMENCVGAASGSTVECLAAYELIDCGDNVELFKALAAMNDENCREQWFTDGVTWGLCKDDYWDIQVAEWDARNDDERLNMSVSPQCHKATAEEIIAHFKNVEIHAKSR